MATQRVKIDTKGKNIIQLFMSNMNKISALNKLSAGPGDANTYAGGDPWWGPDGNVDITWPKKGTYNHTGTWPQPYQRYFVREITAPVEAPVNEYGFGEVPLASPLNSDDNDMARDGENNTDVKDSFGGKSPRTLEYTDNVYNNVDAVGHGRGPQGSFMATKGRKSLFTLLQETWGAFFDGDRGPVFRRQGTSEWENVTNRYAGGTKSYDFTYMSQQGSSYVDPPSAVDVQSQAMQGFVLGQIYGGQDPSVQARIRREAQNITRDYFLQSAANAEDDSLKAFYENLAGIVAGVDRISQLYVPGWGRPAENYLTRKPLSENLNQNLLLPPPLRNSGITSPLSMPGNINDNGTGPPGQGLTEKTFQSLYTKNRAGKVGGVNVVNPIFNNGILGGSAINLLQEPMDRSAAMIKADPTAPVPNITTVPFAFKKDDARYLTYDRKETGFTSNGPNTNAQPSKMEPAIDDVSVMGTAGRVSQAGLARETVSRVGQGQFFPFTFSTLNKKDPGGAGRHQVCYLQAIINSLGESYTPTWASKHFFGRTEQVHTYTFTDRTIDLSFTIFANEMRQLQNVYERVLWLAQQCYPDFDNTGRVSEGPMVALRVGDLFQYKAGLIRSLSYDWMFAGGKWEMTAGMRMPQGVTVTLSYQIIHNTIPSRNTDFYGGPAGGLNAATERYRQLGNQFEYGTGNAFDSFETLDIDQVAYGQRLIPAGKEGGSNDVRSFLDDVKARNYVGVDGATLSEMKQDDFKVPVGVGAPATEDNPNGVQWAT